MRVSIDPVAKRDLKTLVAIEDESFPEPWTEGMLRAEISDRDTRRYTKAVVGGTIAGYLGLMFVMDEVHVNTIATTASMRGRGIATLLLLDGIEASLQRGAPHLTLEVAANNTAAQALYRRFGLAPVGIRRGYYAGGIDAIVMWGRDLDAEVEVERRRAIAHSLGSAS